MRESKIDPNWKPVAFKEWQVVMNAIASGEQSLILRKGGISEGKAGFQWLHDQFLLFPSLFHEQTKLVHPKADGSKRELVGPTSSESDSDVNFSVHIEAIETGRLSDWSKVLELSPYHIWTEECIRERYIWGDEPGISYALIRATILEKAWVLPDRKGFGGCRSWIGLPADEAGGCNHLIKQGRVVEPTCGYPNL